MGPGGAAQHGRMARPPPHPWELIRGSAVRDLERPESASPATGSGKRHQQEQADIVNEALTTESILAQRPARVVARRKS